MNDDIVAFQGELILEKATHDTEWGMYATFVIPQDERDVGTANPFKKFTKMRKGKVGTRFHAVFAEDSDVVYDDEVLLKGWSDTTAGWKVTFWFSAFKHPFLTYSKEDRFGLALVELQSDNEPINQKKRERLTRAEARKKYPLAMLAGQWCKADAFKEFLARRYGVRNPMGGMITDTMASDYIRQCCQVESRRDLDLIPEAADIFHNSFRRPYVDWLDNRVT